MYIENFASKVKAWGLSHGKKGSRLQLCFWVIDDVPEKEGMDLCMWKQMSSSKCSFTCICGIFLPLNPYMTTVYARSAFYPSLRFTLSTVCILHTVCILPPVCSLQSSVRSLCFTLTASKHLLNMFYSNSSSEKIHQLQLSWSICRESGKLRH